MRGLGVVRADGWLGGVCAGIAYRLGIDPLIVRGIVVVAGILGVPVLLLYAAAWALLPDRDGNIHLQRLFEGDFEPPMVAIGVMLLLSLLPWASGFWWAGGPFWDVPAWGEIVGRVVWTLVVIGAVVALIVVAVQRSDGRWSDGSGRASGWGASGASGVGSPGAHGSSAGQAQGAWAAQGPSAARAQGSPAGQAQGSSATAGAGAPDASGTGAPAATDTGASTATDTGAPAGQAHGPSVGATAAGSTASTVAASTVGASTVGASTGAASTGAPSTTAADTVQLDIAAEPTPPPAPPQGASPEDLADWQQRQAQWRADHAAWKQRLAADMRAVKAQRSAEQRARVAVATAEAAARRDAYRAANPRVGAAVGWLTVGLALVAGSIVAIVWPQLAEVARYTTAAGLAAATLVVGVVVLIAGLARRRSGFLIFLGILLAALTVAALVLAGDGIAGIHLTHEGLPALLQQ
jgi:phage shock protein PspC (stress-responsive transcriptional regulator)